MGCQLFDIVREALTSTARIERAILARQTGGTKLLDQFEAARKVRRLAPRTIQFYRRWVQELLRFHGERRGQ